MKELVGVALAVASALLYDLGYVLEKQALDRLPTLQPSPLGVLRVARSSRRWLLGFVSMLVGLGLQVGALTLAPVSVVQPILAGGLIALAAAGSSLLGERLTRRHHVALGLVVVAVVCVGASAHKSGRLAHHVPARSFLVLAGLIAVVAAISARTGLARRPRSGRLTLSGLTGTALAAGLLYGLGAIAEKAVATRMVGHGVLAGSVTSLATPYPWIFLVATLVGMMVFQVGLQAHAASLMASLSNVTSTVCALVGASVVFQEALLPAGWWSLPRLAGFACVLASVAILALEDDKLAGTVEDHRSNYAVAP